MKILDFFLEGGHYIIDADITQFEKTDYDTGCRWLRRILGEPEVYNVYEDKDGILSPFPFKGWNQFGSQMGPVDALRDIAGRITRNETGKLTVNYIWPELKEALDEFQRYPAITGDRTVPYFIYYGYDIAQLAYATNEFLYYYLRCYDELLMFRTSDGTVVSDNGFAEIGLSYSEEGVAEGTEYILPFTDYSSDMDM